MVKKISALLIVLSMCFTGVFAAQEAPIIYGSTTFVFDSAQTIQSAEKMDSAVILSDDIEVDLTEVEEYIANQLESLNTSIDISSFGVSTAYVKTIAADVINNNPNLFYIDTSYGYSFNKITNTIVAMHFSVVYDSETITARKAAFDEEVNHILSYISPEMSDFEKLLTVHDYFALNYEYNASVSSSSEAPEAFRADGILVDKTGVCQAYSLAFKYIMNLLQIDCSYAISDTMNHIWNVVKLDGQWYHVDITWDDPLPDRFSLAAHTYFLLSDDAIYNEDGGHYDWNCSYACTSTLYDDICLRASQSAVAIGDNALYYTDGSDICKYDTVTKTSSTVCTIPGRWYVWDNKTYYYSASFVRIFLYDGRIYFNTPTEIQSIAPDGTDLQTFYTYLGGDGYIYGLMNDGDYLKYGISTAPSIAATVYPLPIINMIEAEKDGNGYAVRLISKDSISGNLIVSVFDNSDTLLRSQVYTAASSVPVSIDAPSGSYTRFMWWNLSSLTPCSGDLTVENN